MNFYLELLDEPEWKAKTLPSASFFRAEKDSLEVEYALRTSTKPMGVAEYQLFPNCPKNSLVSCPAQRKSSKN